MKTVVSDPVLDLDLMQIGKMPPRENNFAQLVISVGERHPALHGPYPVKLSGSTSISQNSYAADCLLHSPHYPKCVDHYRLLTRRSVH